MSAEWGGPAAVADMLVEAIQYNANILGHYVLHAFVVVPNHVHLRADPAVTLPKLTKSLKRHHCQASQHDVGIDGKPLLAGRAMTTWCGMRGSSRRSGTALRGILCGQGWCGKPAGTDGRALGRSWGGPFGRLRRRAYKWHSHYAHAGAASPGPVEESRPDAYTASSIRLSRQTHP